MSRKRLRRATTVGTILVLTALAACRNEPTGGGDIPPQPGDATATVVSPNGDEGSAVLEVTGGTVLDVRTDEAYVRVYRVPTDPVRIVVARLRPGELTFRLTTDDVGHLPGIRVVEVGAPDDRLRPDITGYSVTVLAGDGS